MSFSSTTARHTANFASGPLSAEYTSAFDRNRVAFRSPIMATPLPRETSAPGPNQTAPFPTSAQPGFLSHPSSTTPRSNRDGSKAAFESMSRPVQRWQLTIPLERISPHAYRTLQVLHLDHILVISGKLRVALLFNIVVALTFGLILLSDILQFAWLSDVVRYSSSCTEPWKASGLAKFNVIYDCIGVVAFLMLAIEFFYALCSFDDDPGGTLSSKKTKELNELRRQCTGVLAHTQDQIREVFDSLTDALGCQLDTCIENMKIVVQRVSLQRQIRLQLVLAMSRCLYNVRLPALRHFDKLMALVSKSGSGYRRSLKTMISEQSQQSIALLICPDIPPVDLPRAPEQESLHGRNRHDGVTASFYDMASDCFSSNCEITSLLRDVEMPDSGHATEVELAASLNNLRRELAPRTDADHVLLPVRLVMKSLTLFPMLEERCELSSSSVDLTSRRFQCLESINGRLTHRLLLGLFISFLIIAFHIYTACIFLYAWSHGGCSGKILSCTWAALRLAFVLMVLFCFIVVLSYVVWNVHLLDNVLQIRLEILKLEDFKRELDGVNAHSLAGTNEEKDWRARYIM